MEWPLLDAMEALMQAEAVGRAMTLQCPSLLKMVWMLFVLVEDGLQAQECALLGYVQLKLATLHQ